MLFYHCVYYLSLWLRLLVINIDINVCDLFDVCCQVKYMKIVWSTWKFWLSIFHLPMYALDVIMIETAYLTFKTHFEVHENFGAFVYQVHENRVKYMKIVWSTWKLCEVHENFDFRIFTFQCVFRMSLWLRQPIWHSKLILKYMKILVHLCTKYMKIVYEVSENRHPRKTLCIREKFSFIPKVPMYSSIIGTSAWVHMMLKPLSHSVRV